MPEKASGNKTVPAVAQWQGQQNSSLCPSGSTLTACKGGNHCNSYSMADVLEHKTVTGLVVMVAVT